MGTTVKSIGSSSRDYSTIASWEAGAPANLVTDGNIWKGECYNDSEFAVTSTTTLSGSTSDSTHYKWLTTASGQSFVDHANKLTNVPKYNQSYGVGIKSNTGYLGNVGLITLSENYAVVEKLQLKYGENAGPDNSTSIIKSNNTGNIVKNCILEGGAYCKIGYKSGASGPIIVNSIIINRNSASDSYGGYMDYPNGATAVYNCTIVRPNGDGTTGTGVKSSGGSGTVKNCAIFGFATVTSGSFDAASGYNATDAASAPGSNNQTSATYADQFTNYSNSVMDFRAA